MKLALFFYLVLSLPCLAQTIEIESKFKANFKQERYIKSSDFTLKSSGQVVVDPSEMLSWKQIEPFEFEMIISPQRIIQKGPGGESKQVDNIIMKKVSGIIFSLFTDDLKKLEKEFSIKKNKDSFVLLPLSKEMSKIIKEIRLTKDKYLKQFYLIEKGGNWLRVNFKDHQKLK